MSIRTVMFGVALLCTFAAPALADAYPFPGKWGESSGTDKGAIDCNGKHVIGFDGDQRTDNKGGVPAFRNRSVTSSAGGYRVVDVFTTGQISNGRTTYDLRKIDADRIEMKQQGGKTLTLQRCK